MIEQLREELEADEGVINAVYLDHLGLKTCAIGHLCQAGEPEYEMEVGEAVSEERVAELFEQDIAGTLDDCQRLMPDFDMLPEQVRLIVANMCFNLGQKRFGGFRKMLEAIEDGDWERAADEMLDSKWARQLPARSSRLISRMRAV
jgi:GH24 family phage-related lysozyme (muramidase)